MSMPQDYVVHLFLLVILGTALYRSLIISVFGVSTSNFGWFIGLLILDPDPSLIANQSLVMRIHVVTLFQFWAHFPFTKLVHLWSAPLDYLVRPYITMRGYESIYPGESGDKHRWGGFETRRSNIDAFSTEIPSGTSHRELPGVEFNRCRRYCRTGRIQDRGGRT